jgi:hypothetical protein
MGEFTLTNDHIKLLRHLVLVWVSVESGAPFVDYDEPYGSPSAAPPIAG